MRCQAIIVLDTTGTTCKDARQQPTSYDTTNEREKNNKRKTETKERKLGKRTK